MKLQQKLAIIGSGTAGICAAKHSIQQGFDVTVFEQGAQVGGTWNYTDQVGKNEYGLDVHSSMYKGLITNLQKEAMGFPDHEITACEGESYIPANYILEFLQSYALKYKIMDVTKFEHHVIRVKPINDNKNWEIIVKNLKEDVYEAFYYDFVLICTGHHSVPRHPSYPGLNRYMGIYFHCHDYRDAQLYRDKKVLIVGGGFSALDISLQISEVTKSVTISHHLTEDNRVRMPKRIIQVPDIENFTENEVVFVDGAKDKFDVIIFCTGYLYSYPFLSIESGIYVENNSYVRPLYKHILNINNPTMAFIGIPDIVCVSQMCDLQVRFILRYFTGQKELPTKIEMLCDTENEMEERWKKGYKKHRAHLMDKMQEEYFAQLSKIAEVENVPIVCIKLFNEKAKRLKNDVEYYRKFAYKIVDNENFEYYK